MRTRKITVYEKIQEEIKKKEILDPERINLLPKRWKRIGHVLIIDLKDELAPARFDIGATYLKYVPRVQTVLWRRAPTDLTIRKPHYEIIAGKNNTVVLFKENGVKYVLDASKLTFSAGNHHERIRLVNLVKQSSHPERVLDMFACVGNLSMPLAVHVPQVEIVAIELNPLAYMYLRKTIKLNHVQERYHPILGDNRKITPEGYFNRILMGYFGISNLQLKKAVESLDPYQGGWIHLHELQPDNKGPELPNRLQWLLVEWNEKRVLSTKYKVADYESKRVKWIAARLQHLVSDVKVVPIS